MHGFPIQAVEAYPGPRHGNIADEAIHAGVLGVRYSDAASDSRRAEQFPLQHRLDDVFRIGALEVAGGPEHGYHFPNYALLGRGRDLRNNRVTNHKVSHPHRKPPSDPAAPGPDKCRRATPTSHPVPSALE